MVTHDSLDSGTVAESRTLVIALKAMHVKNAAVLASASILLALNKRRRTLILAPVSVAVIVATLYGSLGLINVALYASGQPSRPSPAPSEAGEDSYYYMRRLRYPSWSA